MTELEAAAVAYARRGWHVFPLVPKRKTPLTRHGLLDASSDPGLAAARWADQPHANIGLACGASGLLVVDLDGEPGSEAWSALVERNGGPVRTLAARTGAGFHLYFTGEARSSASRLGPGVDTRGAGGYVVCPPSLHASGTVYRWLDPEAPLLPVPAWLVAALESPRARPVGEHRRLAPDAASTRYGLAALAGLVDAMASAGDGRRNHTLNALAYRAGRLVAAGELAETLVREQLVASALARGLDPTEARRTFDSGFNSGLQRPASITRTANEPKGAA